MFNPDLSQVGSPEPPNVDRIPEFGGNAEILTAPHQGVGLAAFHGRGQRFDAEVVVFALGLRDKANGGLVFEMCDKYLLEKTYRPLTMSAYSRVTIESPTTGSPRGIRLHPIGPNVSFNLLLYLISGR